jgi:hypothetical protein
MVPISFLDTIESSRGNNSDVSKVRLAIEILDLRCTWNISPGDDNTAVIEGGAIPMHA